MDREILFRGKRKSDGKWVFGYVVPTTTNTYDKGVDIIDTDGIDYDELDYFIPGFGSDPVVPESVGQFIGLTDKNGKKIFEGDVIGYNGTTGYVNYEFGCFCVHEMGKSENNPAIDIVMISNAVEVIGNIHDNPELLKGGVEGCG